MRLRPGAPNTRGIGPVLRDEAHSRSDGPAAQHTLHTLRLWANTDTTTFEGRTLERNVSEYAEVPLTIPWDLVPLFQMREAPRPLQD